MSAHRTLVIALLFVAALVAPAAAAPEGQATWAIHVSLAPTWFDPAETPGVITPFMTLYALHDAVVKPMPGRPIAPSLAETWSGSEDGLAFDFIAAAATPVVTGHASGLITINLAEADDAERERQRNRMGEPYRTLLGHFRHEIAHYYWSRLIENSNRLEEFRALFGDEQQDYVGTLQNHYANGPPPDWPTHFVTAYASAHPWEDFAETWAHYLHIVDTLETASAFGVRIAPAVDREGAHFAVVDDVAFIHSVINSELRGAA